MDFYRWRPHPWHGLEVGVNPPELINVYLEITPFDSMKYEVDKATGYLRIDRPQIGSSLPPCAYGFIPRTYCAERVAALAVSAKEGDGDPLDVFLLSASPITRAEILVTARVVGGVRTIDGGKADDKLIAVLENDPAWDEAADVKDVPEGMISRIRHYLTTYKLTPGNDSPVTVEEIYGAVHARRVLEAGIADYAEHFSEEA